MRLRLSLPQATGTALASLHDVISDCQHKDPDAALVVIGDLNKTRLGQFMLNFYQHVTCPTRGNSTLDHPVQVGIQVSSSTGFQKKSDHMAIFLILKYKQKLTQVAPPTKEVKCCRTRLMMWMWPCSGSAQMTSVSFSSAGSHFY